MVVFTDHKVINRLMKLWTLIFIGALAAHIYRTVVPIRHFLAHFAQIAFHLIAFEGKEGVHIGATAIAAENVFFFLYLRNKFFFEFLL